MASSLVRPAMAMLIVALVVEIGSRSVQAEPAVSGAAKGSDAQVTLKPLTITLTSDVQVRQSPVIRLRAAHPGILSELAVAPGDPVTAGEVIGHLGGPAITAALKQAKSDLRAAQTAVKTNQSLLTLAQQRADAHFGSRQEVYQATLARDAAKARVANSKVSLHRLQTQHSLRAPADGVISATPSVAGDAVRDGDAIVSIQPDRALWLEGQYFGAELRQVRTGQTGVFTPSDDAAPMTVEVTGLLPLSNGLTVRFRPVANDAGQSGAATLYAGETGRVDIQVVRPPQPAVPSEALVLDQGRWWVMLEDDNGAHPEAVDPIASIDGWSWLQGNVSPGDRVRVSDAYLSFHQSFSTRYQQPD